MTTTSSLLSLEKSELRKKLLLYFFTNPEWRGYVREIAQLLKVDPTNLSRELRRLESEGVFRSETSGHQKYFFLNKDFRLYNELKSGIDKTIGGPTVLKNHLANIPGIKQAFIYGSFAKGTEKAHSDIDVCLISEKGGFQEDKLLHDLKKLEVQLGREISYIFFTEQEWTRRLKAKDSFLVGLEKGKKIKLIDDKKN